MNPSCRNALALAALCGAALSACGSIRPEIDATVVTAVPKDVEKCQRLKEVETDSPELSPDDGLNQLREQAVKQGGNTVLVRSYALSGTGVAYACNPPLNPETHNAHPRGN